jgi:CRISPR-associated endonuclease/helicase Cas3
LRLLTSDLVLDEPDDFDQSDLPALTRLIHFAGLFGSKVLLSAATLTPDFSEGLYQAYAAGRAIWNRHMGINPALPVCCAWFDEYDQVQQPCASGAEFASVHQRFAAKRSQKLQSQPARRKAEIVPMQLPPSSIENQKVNVQALAVLVLQSALRLHHAHAETCPITGKRASIGLLRMANVNPIIQLVQSLYAQPALQADVQIHLCCYHAKQLLILRSALEQKLDRILARSKPNAIFAQPEIRHVLDSSAASQHVFLVVASPVAEVGRDHDYDWAIVEPSSMRSIIQLAGRVWRHRPEKVAATPNVLILDRNIRGLRGDELAFMRPGFEQVKQFKLNTHDCHELITPEELDSVDAVPRIIRAAILQPKTHLADLEHAVMADLLNNSTNFVSAFWRTNNGNHPSAHLQKISPFRNNDYPQDDYVCLPVNDACTEFKFTYAEAAWEDLEHCEFQTNKIRFAEFQTGNDWVKPWLSQELSEALLNLSQQLGEDNLAKVARQYAQVRLERAETQWQFHPWFGFWKTKDTA